MTFLAPLDEVQQAREMAGGRVRWLTNPQRQAAEVPYPLTVWWGANGVGKSVGLAEAVRRALACEHPWMEPGPHVVTLAGNTWTQLGNTIKYLWAMADRRWFSEKLRYEGGGLHGQKHAVYDIVSGPCKGGELRCGTFRAGAANLAGPRVKFVASDEPLPEDIYNELWARLLGRDGRMLVTFTPTMGTSHKIGYLWERVDDPERPWAGQLQTTLTLDAVTPRGRVIAGRPVEVPWLSQRELDRVKEGWSPAERDMRSGLSREPRVEGAYFEAWGPHLLTDTERPQPGTPVGIGIDHGSKPGAQRAVMIAVSGIGQYAQVWVLDEYYGEGRTESEDDAKGIIDMLARHGMTLADVDYWMGDRAHHGDRKGGAKSNSRLKAAFSRATGGDPRRPGWHDKLPYPLRRIKVPRKFDGSVWDGCTVIHQLMVGPLADPPRPARIYVATRCTHLDEDLRQWEGRTTDPHKDGIDALRYIVVPMVEGKHLDRRPPRR